MPKHSQRRAHRLRTSYRRRKNAVRMNRMFQRNRELFYEALMDPFTEELVTRQPMAPIGGWPKWWEFWKK